MPTSGSIWKPTEIAKARKLRIEGKIYKEIAKELGRTHTSVKAYFYRWNISPETKVVTVPTFMLVPKPPEPPEIYDLWLAAMERVRLRK